MRLLNVAIVGARGYVGAELAVLLSRHPYLRLAAAFSRSLGGTQVGDSMPQLKDEARRSPRAAEMSRLLFSEASPEAVAAAHCDVVVLALPNGASAPFIDAIAAEGGAQRPLVVDVSADGRFTPDKYTYGLPEVNNNRERLVKMRSQSNSRLIANPGCYATASQLGLWPLVRAGLIDKNSRSPTLFGVSGFSGAGSTPSPKTDPVFLAESLLPYSLIGHLHEREIGTQMGVAVRFMPHVAPFFRGIQMTIDVELNRSVPLDVIRRLYDEAYTNEPFVTVDNEPPRARQLANTHGGAIGGFTLNSTRLVVTTAIDNLLKGAASQAVQNINIGCDFPETTGLVPSATTSAAKSATTTKTTTTTTKPIVSPTQCHKCWPTCVGCVDANRFFVNNYSRPGDILLVRGDGVKVYDQHDNEYLDFTSGIAVNAFGHSDRRWATIVADQAARLAHTSNLLHSDKCVALAEALVEQAKPYFDAKVFIANSGTEANEAALKFARLARPGGTFVSFKGSFHGRSIGSLSVTYKPVIRTPFNPLLPCVWADFNTATDQELAAIVTHDVAAVIIEPVQGEGGVRAATPAFMRRVRAACDASGAALIYDEVQSGLGRTGSFFAFSGLGVPAPDMLTMAKPLGGGLPAAATLVNQRLAEKIVPGCHGSTFAGNATIAAAAVDTIHRLSQPDLLRGVIAKGERLATLFAEALGEHCVEMRGVGLLRGAQLRAPLTAAGLIAACRKRRLLIVGTDDPQVVRILPPLIVDEPDLAAAAEILREAAKDAVAEAENGAKAQGGGSY